MSHCHQTDPAASHPSVLSSSASPFHPFCLALWGGFLAPSSFFQASLQESIFVTPTPASFLTSVTQLFAVGRLQKKEGRKEGGRERGRKEEKKERKKEGKT
jgi:acyl-CoA synthetase (NDP forming)